MNIVHSAITLDARDDVPPHNTATASYTFPAGVAAGDILLVALFRPQSGGQWNDGGGGNNYFPGAVDFRSGTDIFWSRRVCDGTESGLVYSYSTSVGPGSKIGISGWLIRGGVYLSNTYAEDFDTNSGSLASPVDSVVPGAGSVDTQAIDFWVSSIWMGNAAFATFDPATNDAGLAMLQASIVGRDSTQPFTPWFPAHTAMAQQLQGLSGAVTWTNSSAGPGGAFTTENWEAGRLRILFSLSGAGFGFGGRFG